jgi:hypothetical protein
MPRMNRATRAERRGRPGWAAFGLSALLFLPAVAQADETLTYTWRVEGFFGAVAGMFFPSRGDASLVETTLAGGNVQSSLLITSREDKDESFFRYEAEIDPASGSTVAARSSQLWRGKSKNKSSPNVDAGAVDVASAIHLLRRTLPTRRLELEIWSDGRLYPVEVVPLGVASRQVGGGKVETRHYSIRPYSIRPLVRPDRRVWKGELDLWFAQDEVATPVEMLVARPPAKLRLELVQQP